MYEQALVGWAWVKPVRGQWEVHVYILFEDGYLHEGYIQTYFREHVALFAAKVITAAMNRTDIRERGAIDY